MFYKLTPINDLAKPFVPYNGKCFCQIVRARTEKQARQAASEQAQGEGSKAWLDKKITRCEKLSSSGEAVVLCQDKRDPLE